MLTAEQCSVVRQILKGLKREQVHTIGDFAGTGKSVVLGVLAEALPAFAACAFTGKAAHVLHERGTPATTIHSIIYSAVPQPDGGVEFRRRPAREVHCDGFLIDEAAW
jgi:exodeoxyribonuclease-5